MADSPQYVDETLVTDELPVGYSTTDLPSAAVLQFIDEEGRDIDTRLGPTYCTFNAYNHSTYPTPTQIQESTRDGAVAKCLMRIGMGDRSSTFGSLARERRDNAMRIRQALAGEDQVAGLTGANAAVASQLAMLVEKVSTQTITFGTGASQFVLMTNEAYVPVESFLTSGDIPTIMPESIRVVSGSYTGYRFGGQEADHKSVDGICYFDGERQRWVLRDLSGYISGSGVTVSISYRWEWRRATWRPVPYIEDDEVYFGGAV